MTRHLLPFGLACAVLASAACSGGSSSSSPATAPTLPAGAGINVPLDQKIALTVTIPPAATGIVSKAAVRSSGIRRTATLESQYISAKTGSIVLSLATVDGKSLINVPPPIAPIDPASFCSASLTGCTFTTPNDIPAAKGINRYLVTTFAGTGGTGNVISTGFIDITVPSPTGAKLGPGTLSIGGYAASIVLGSTIPLTFTTGKPSTAGLLVQAFDPAGAAIVGGAIFNTPLTVSISDSVDFNIAGSAQYQVPGPITTPIPLAYTGGTSLTGSATITASTTDENGAVATAVPIVATIVGTPAPTAPPSVSNESLYVDLTDDDTVTEFDLPSKLENHQPPNPSATPRRAITLAIANPPTSLACTPNSSYDFSNTTGSGTNGIAVSKSGSIYLNSACSDSSNFYSYGFSATSHGSTNPTFTNAIPIGPYGVGLSTGGPLAVDVQTDALYVGGGSQNSNASFRFPTDRSNAGPIAAIGFLCFDQVPSMTNPNCQTDFTLAEAVAGAGFAAYANNLYIPGNFNGPTLPPGDPATVDQNVAVYPVTDTTQSMGVAFPVSTLTGADSLFDPVGNPVPPTAAVVDGTTLYVLQYSDTGFGLCQQDPKSTDMTNLCQDQQLHSFLTAYSLGPALLGPAAFNTNVSLPPIFALGGDTVGGFGCVPTNPGQFLAAHAGFVYVLNAQPPPCTAGVYAPEIDVYDTNGKTGAHLDVAPVARIKTYADLSHTPFAIAVGPTGPASSIGGLEVLRRGKFHARYDLRRPWSPASHRFRRPYRAPLGRSWSR